MKDQIKKFLDKTIQNGDLPEVFHSSRIASLVFPNSKKVTADGGKEYNTMTGSVTRALRNIAGVKEVGKSAFSIDAEKYDFPAIQAPAFNISQSRELTLLLELAKKNNISLIIHSSWKPPLHGYKEDLIHNKYSTFAVNLSKSIVISNIVSSIRTLINSGVSLNQINHDVDAILNSNQLKS
jgi:hypothetical protein